jgi:2',3'-cyclic-nucleotide 2'-phosphodiesterase (5'-nucleotidase family)
MQVKKISIAFLFLVLIFIMVGCNKDEPVHVEPDSSEAEQYVPDIEEPDSEEPELIDDAEIVEVDEIVEIDLSEFNQFHLTILHTNDWHGVLHNVAAYATLVQEIRDETENVLLLDAGDIHRRGIFQELLGEAEVAVMNAMGYDGMAFGNNDFPRDDEPFDITQIIIQQTDFPVLCGNVTTLDGEYVEGFTPYMIITMQEIDIAIIGVTSPKPWDRGFDFIENYLFEDPVLAVERLTEETSEMSDIQIVLSHAAFEFDRQMHMVSAVIGGDDHRILRTPFVIDHEDRRIPVVQAGGEQTHFLGRLDLLFIEIDGEWILHSFSGELLSLQDVMPDTDIQDIIDSYIALLGLES